MTKEQFIMRWSGTSESDLFRTEFEAIIATEIEKAKVQPQPSDKVQISKHTLVEVNRAFRALKQDRNSYIHKVFSDDGVFDAMNEIRQVHEAHYGSKKEEQPKLDPIEAWKQYKEENKPHPELNPIEQAYERGEKIRRKDWHITHWIKKHSDTEAIHEPKNIYDVTNWAFRTEPSDWELYTEPTEQPSSQAKLDNSFDRERFEAMFRAVIETHEATMNALKQLDAYYATKEGGENE